jgi:hypothetical protein
MSSGDAKAIAEEFLATTNMRGFKASFVEAKKQDRWPSEWAVIFDIHDALGHLMDGPMIITVDEGTRRARAFESP